MELELLKIWFVLLNIANYQLIKGTLMGKIILVCGRASGSEH
jgi:hypothetical protein